MPSTLNVTLPLSDSSLRDLTRWRLSLRQSSCTLLSSINATDTKLKLSTIASVSVGTQLYISDLELVTVVGMPDSSEPTTVTVKRGDTSILSTVGAVDHPIGSVCNVLKYKDVNEIGQELLRGDIQRLLVSMGSLSETLTGIGS